MKMRSMVFLVCPLLLFISACEKQSKAVPSQSKSLRGASSYTPYDAFSMHWARESSNRTIVWVSSGGEAGKLLVSSADPSRRPDWAFCTQGVVAGLVARGEDVVIIGTTYHSSNVVRPVFRKPSVPMIGARSLFIPRSSIEFAFDRLLEREGLRRADVRVPAVENPSFTSITSLLAKEVDETDALDFAVLVDPFITNLLGEHPNQYELGEGNLYDLYYCIVVRRSDLDARRQDFVGLLREFLRIDDRIEKLKSNPVDFQNNMWGRMKDGKEEILSKMLTYDPKPASLRIDTFELRSNLEFELRYLCEKYPNDLKMPTDVHKIIDDSLLREIAPDRASPEK